MTTIAATRAAARTGTGWATNFSAAFAPAAGRFPQRSAGRCRGATGQAVVRHDRSSPETRESSTSTRFPARGRLRQDLASAKAGQHNDYYLLLDGISGGGHAFQDANCIVRYAEHGVISGLPTRIEARAVGHGSCPQRRFRPWMRPVPGRLHRYARKLYAGSSGDTMAIAAALDGVGDVDWQRHIVRHRGSWTVVHRSRRGQAARRSCWPNAIGTSADTSRPPRRPGQPGQRALYLHLQTAGVRPEGMRGGTDRVEIVRTCAVPARPHGNRHPAVRQQPPGQTGRELGRNGTWLASARRRRHPSAGPSRSGAGMTIVSQGRARRSSVRAPAKAAPSYPQAVAARPVRGPSTLPLTPARTGSSLSRGAKCRVGSVADHGHRPSRRRSPGGGNRPGDVVVFGAGGAPSASVQVSQRDRFPALFRRRPAGRRGTRRPSAEWRPTARTRWQHAIPYVNIPWPNWGEGKSRIREIASADMRGDGRRRDSGR